MSRLARYLVILASLFALFTISYGGMVCVEKPPSTKDYVIFHGLGDPVTAECVFDGEQFLCCADVEFEDNFSVTFVLTNNTTVEKVYWVNEVEINGLKVTKAYDRYTAFITLYGKEGNYLVVEHIPKEKVESASLILSDAAVMEYDPVIAWFVSLDGNEQRLVKYTVKRGSVPQTMPRIFLAECELDILPEKNEILRKGETSLLLYRFKVLYKGEPIIPPRVEVEVLGKQVDYKIVPDLMSIEVLANVGSSPDKIPVNIKVRFGDCEKTKSYVLYPTKEDDTTLYLYLFVAIMAFLTVAFLIYRRRS